MSMAYDQFLVCQRIFIDFERSARTRCVVQGEICDTSTIPTPMSSEMRSVLGRIRADVVHEEVGARLHLRCVVQREICGTRPYSHRCRQSRGRCSAVSTPMPFKKKVVPDCSRGMSFQKRSVHDVLYAACFKATMQSLYSLGTVPVQSRLQSRYSLGLENKAFSNIQAKE